MAFQSLCRFPKPRFPGSRKETCRCEPVLQVPMQLPHHGLSRGFHAGSLPRKCLHTVAAVSDEATKLQEETSEQQDEFRVMRPRLRTNQGKANRNAGRKGQDMAEQRLQIKESKRWQGHESAPRGKGRDRTQDAKGPHGQPPPPKQADAPSKEGRASIESPYRKVVARTDLPILREGIEDKGTFFDYQGNWNKLGLSSDVWSALHAVGFKRPSHIQAATLRAWGNSEARHIAMADQAGSGKTLAYLLPLIQAMRSEDNQAGHPLTHPKSPRAIVVAPTTELAQQVYRVAKALSNAGARMRVSLMTGGQVEEKERSRSWRTQRETLASGIDLMVATPGRLKEHLSAKNVDLSHAKAVVLDEVDILLSDATMFAEQLDALKSAAPPSLRFVFVTATIPQQMAFSLAEQFPGIGMVTGPGLHRTSVGLTEELVDCSGGDEVSLESGINRKLDALGSSISKHGARRVLVFCNKIETCRSVENYLLRKRSNLKVLAYHEAIREDKRQEAMNHFLAPVVDRKEDAPLVLVATDRMSRGIDSMYCGHVVLFDFPRDPSEYVRRVGRTARGAGGTGVVTALVLGRQVALARSIVEGNAKGRPVHSIPEI